MHSSTARQLSLYAHTDVYSVVISLETFQCHTLKHGLRMFARIGCK